MATGAARSNIFQVADIGDVPDQAVLILKKSVAIIRGSIPRVLFPMGRSAGHWAGSTRSAAPNLGGRSLKKHGLAH